MKLSLKKLALGIAAASAIAFFGCQPVVQATTGYSVIGQVNGRLVNDLGQPVVGATITYNSPNATLAVAKTIVSVTSGSDGRFEANNLQSGTYTFTAVAAAAGNMTRTFAVIIPTLEAISPADADYGNNLNYVKTLDADVIMPRIGGSISGRLFQTIETITPGATPTAVAARTLVLSFAASHASYYLPGGVQYLTATTDANGAFTFTNLPMLIYGGTVANPGSAAYPIKVGTAAASEIAVNAVGATTFALPYIELGVNGQIAVAMTGPLVASAAAYPTLDLVGTNTTSTASKLNSISVPIVLNFNNVLSDEMPTTGALTATDNNKVFATLNDTTRGRYVNATATVSGNSITIVPSINLQYLTTYRVNYVVSDGVTKFVDNPLVGNFSFTTEQRPNGPVAVTNLARTTATTFNAQAAISSLPVSFTYDQNYTYNAYYCVSDKALAAGDTESSLPAETVWTTAGLIFQQRVVNLPALATISASPAWNSGQTVYFKLVQSFTDASTLTTASSNLISVSDAVAPTALTLTGGVAVNYYRPDQYGTYGYPLYARATTTESIPIGPTVSANLSTTTDGVYSFIINLGSTAGDYWNITTAGTEFIANPVIVSFTNSAGVALAADAATCGITPRTSPTATTTLTLTLNRAYANAATPYFQNMVVNLIIADSKGNLYAGGTAGALAVTISGLTY